MALQIAVRGQEQKLSTDRELEVDGSANIVGDVFRCDAAKVRYCPVSARNIARVGRLSAQLAGEPIDFGGLAGSNRQSRADGRRAACRHGLRSRLAGTDKGDAER